MITILDYGMGNLRSVQKALEALGAESRISPDIEGAEKVIIPGVGAFGAAMEKLAPMRSDIRAFADSGRPLLGICLGQQLLLDSSEELGEFEGLGIVPGRVRYLPSDMGLKVPHMGWSSLSYRSCEGLAKGAVEGEQVYFVHSLYTDCAEPQDILATAEYGLEFPAAIKRGNVWGTQFHPEKSGSVGLRMLRQFVEC